MVDAPRIDELDAKRRNLVACELVDVRAVGGSGEDAAHEVSKGMTWARELPEAERDAWRALWSAVDRSLDRVC